MVSYLTSLLLSTKIAGNHIPNGLLIFKDPKKKRIQRKGVQDMFVNR